MTRNVLLVGHDRNKLVAMKSRLAQHADDFSVLLAGDGHEALEHLENQDISVIAADLNLHQIEGFDMLATLSARFPDIPVIIMAGKDTPEAGPMPLRTDTAVRTAKPLFDEQLAQKIIGMLSSETEGGSLQNISSGMFLQLIEMDQKTCTIRLKDRSTSKTGVLFFVEGVLFDARVGGIQGLPAAHEILTWDQVDLSIQNDCAVRQRRINQNLQRMILEAARRKDESGLRPQAAFAPAFRVSEISAPAEVRARIQKKVQNTLGERAGLASVFQDDSWTERVRQISFQGEQLQVGKLVIGYIGRADPHDYIVLAHDPVTVLAVSPKCPRDQLMQLLGG